MFLVGDAMDAVEQEITKADQLLLIDALEKLLVEKEGYYAMAKAMEKKVPGYRELVKAETFGIPQINKLLGYFSQTSTKVLCNVNQRNEENALRIKIDLEIKTLVELHKYRDNLGRLMNEARFWVDKVDIAQEIRRVEDELQERPVLQEV